jgi:hypothetical protein
MPRDAAAVALHPGADGRMRQEVCFNAAVLPTMCHRAPWRLWHTVDLGVLLPITPACPHSSKRRRLARTAWPCTRGLGTIAPPASSAAGAPRRLVSAPARAAIIAARIPEPPALLARPGRRLPPAPPPLGPPSLLAYPSLVVRTGKRADTSALQLPPKPSSRLMGASASTCGR